MILDFKVTIGQIKTLCIKITGSTESRKQSLSLTKAVAGKRYSSSERWISTFKQLNKVVKFFDNSHHNILMKKQLKTLNNTGSTMKLIRNTIGSSSVQQLVLKKLDNKQLSDQATSLLSK